MTDDNTPDPHLSDEKLLTLAKVRPTAVRMLIYRFIKSRKNPVSSLDIETALETVDRSTISRTLATFLEHGILHCILDGSSASKYEICHGAFHPTHDDMHVHFHCQKCGNTVCLPSTAVPHVDLPDGFEAESVNYVITGICSDCSKDIE